MAECHSLPAAVVDMGVGRWRGSSRNYRLPARVVSEGMLRGTRKRTR
jgi:hypothetical protein